MSKAGPQKTTLTKQKVYGLLQQGKASEALGIAIQLCRQNPGDAQSHYLLGTVYGQLKRFDKAAECFRRCTEIQPDAFAAHLNLGQACAGVNNFAAAKSAYRRALKLQPGNTYVTVRLAGIVARDGDLFGAEKMLLDALASEPGSAEVLDMLGNICRNRKQYQQAIDYYKQALQIQPQLSESLLYLGDSLFQLGRIDRAIEQLQRVASLEPRNTAACVLLGHCYKQNGEPGRAREYYERALAIDPDNLIATAGIIDLDEHSGQFDAAHARLLPLVRKGAVEVDIAAAYVRLCHRYDDCEEAIKYAHKVLQNPQVVQDDANRLEYALGRKFDQMGDYDTAFEHYRQANAHQHQNFDVSAHTAFIEELIRIYDRQFFTQAPRTSIRSDAPVFIIGMPRSGTSLTEQILASHPQVYGAGELTLIGGAAQEISGYPSAMNHIDSLRLDEIARRYLDHLHRLAPTATRVIDKQPTNFLHLGLIALAFPDARVIHCTREPLDNCLSIYFQAFGHANRYANSLEQIGLYYRLYLKLIRHTKGLCGLPVYELAYEDLVNRQEETTRKLLEFLGLEWNDDCLAYYRNERFVATPSYDQVREKIYTHAIGRWKNYEKHLQPLKDALSLK